MQWRGPVHLSVACNAYCCRLLSLVARAIRMLKDVAVSVNANINYSLYCISCEWHEEVRPWLDTPVSL